MQRRIAVLGAGGLGRAAIKIVDKKKEMRVTVICDKSGLAASEDGIRASHTEGIQPKESVKGIPEIGRASDDSLAGRFVGVGAARATCVGGLTSAVVATASG